MPHLTQCSPLIALAMAMLLLFADSTTPVAAQEGAFATLTRAAFFAEQPDETIKFYINVLGYEEGPTARNVGPYPAGNHWGIPEGAHLRMTYLKSLDGAYVNVLGLEDSSLPQGAQSTGTQNSYGTIMLIHTVNDIDGVFQKALEGGYTVIKPPTLTTTETSLQMFLLDPNGIRIELIERLK